MEVITLNNEIRAMDLPTYESPFGSSRYQLLSAFRYRKRTNKHDMSCDVYNNMREFMFPVLKYIAQETKNGKNLNEMGVHLISDECKRLYIYLRNCSPRNTYEINYRMIMIIVLSEMIEINQRLSDLRLTYSVWSKGFLTVISLIEGLQRLLDLSDAHKVCIVNIRNRYNNTRIRGSRLSANDVIKNKNYSTLVEYGVH